MCVIQLLSYNHGRKWTGCTLPHPPGVHMWCLSNFSRVRQKIRCRLKPFASAGFPCFSTLRLGGFHLFSEGRDQVERIMCSLKKTSASNLNYSQTAVLQITALFHKSSWELLYRGRNQLEPQLSLFSIIDVACISDRTEKGHKNVPQHENRRGPASKD